MTAAEPSRSGLSPDEAFGLLADRTRMEILRTLVEAGDRLTFSELFARSDYDTKPNFSYHLNKLDGHFISRTEHGYAIRQAGRRVVEAVISGTVTDDPTVIREPADRPCPFCSAPIEVRYRQEHVEMYCPECTGVGTGQDESAKEAVAGRGSLGHISLPPAGIRGRSSTEWIDAATVWTNLELLGTSAGVCPRCSGVINRSVTVCDEHDASAGVCDQCQRRYGVQFEVECGTCHLSKRGIAIVCLLAETDLWAFLTDHGMNPLDPETRDNAPGMLANYEETVQSLDPFLVDITFHIDDAALTLTIDEDVSVVEVSRVAEGGAD